MPLVNMKRTEEPKTLTEATPLEGRATYPYGLCISLEKEDLDKLGITTLPPAGQDVQIMARAVIESTCLRDETNGKEMSIRLQITDLELPNMTNPPISFNEMSTRMYGGK